MAESVPSFRAAVERGLSLRAPVALGRPRGLSDADEQALVWLALAPAWTVPLAEACGFPSQSGSVKADLERLHASGLCLRNRAGVGLDDEGDTEVDGLLQQQYWMSVNGRKEVVQRVLNDPQRGVVYLHDQIYAIGQAISIANGRGVPVSATVVRWATLAEVPYTRGMAERLTREVEAQLAAGQTGSALRWVEAARSLEELLPGELRPAMDRASRGLELFHRREDDERLLGPFVERPEQIEAFDTLIEGPDSLWALHYIGAGGLGKTMLMRYITARLAPSLKAATARVDFDFLNPDYPARAPARLLAQLAEELRRHDRSGEAAPEFAAFDDKVRRLHDRMGLPSADQPVGLAVIRGAEFTELLQTFAKAARSLPQPVLLLLDTCEELAKIRSDGGIPESVEATFTILELLHELLPKSRVVFCGRRPLASAGAGWQYQGPALQTQRPRRPYLRLLEIQGFTRSEAEQFLSERAGVTSALVDPIIQRSADSGDLYRFEWDASQEAAGQASQEPRYSPFRLAQFASWVREDASLTPEAILTFEADHYVNMRIVGRIRHPSLRALLPAVAQLGRFDRETLRATASPDMGDFDEVFEELSDQEWIDVQPSQFLEVKPDLRIHMLEFYQRSAASELDVARHRAADYLERVTLESDLADLDPTHFESVLVLLARQPKRTARWWQSVEHRFARTQEYGWALTLTQRLLADSGPAARQETPVPGPRAGVLTTFAAALLHTRPQADRQSVWVEVAELANLEPDAAVARRLRLRALAGKVVSTRAEPPTPDLVHKLLREVRPLDPSGLDEQLAAALVAALEATLEWVERRRNAQLHVDAALDLIQAIAAAELSPELRAFACSLAGRLSLVNQQPAAALEWLRRALAIELSGGAPNAAPRAKWLDWRSPDDLSARLRLEFIRAAYPALLPPEQVLAEVGADIPNPNTLDAARLGSAILTLRGALAPLSGAELDRLKECWVPNRSGDTSYNAHTAFVPLFAAIAYGLAEIGRVDEALDWLKVRAREAEEANDRFETVQAADRAALHIVGRMRLREERRGVNTSLAHSTRLEDQALLWRIEGLDEPRSSARLSLSTLRRIPSDWWEQYSWYHAQWSRVYALKPELGGAAVAWAADTLAWERLDTKGSSAQLECYLDAVEANLLSERLHLPAPFPSLRLIEMGPTQGGVDPTQWAREHAAQPMEALTLLLRSVALAARGADAASIPEELPRRVGLRRAAQLALDEGELLALRLPERGVVLLEQARSWYVECSDTVGALLAQSCAAIALARVGDTQKLHVALERIETHYQALRQNPELSGADRLPGWTTLQSAAAGPGGDALHDVAPNGWRPWLIRIIACLAWDRHAGKSSRAVVPILAWLDLNYSATVDNEHALPAELDDWLAAALLPVTPPRRRTDPRRLVRFKMLRSLLQWISIISPALFILGLTAVGGLSLRPQPNSPFFGIAGSTAYSIAGGVAALGGGVILLNWSGKIFGWAFKPFRWAYGWLRRHAISRSELALTIRSAREAPRSAGLPRTVHVELALQRRKAPAWYSQWIPDTWRLSAPSECKCLVAGLAPYRQSADGLPAHLGRELRRVQGQLQGSTTLMEILVDQRLNWIAWEGIAACALKQVQAPGDVPFLFRRRVAAAVTRPHAPLQKVSRVLSWTTDLAQEVTARQGWAAVIGDARFTYWATRSGELRPGEAPPHILHLVGTPFETASGVRMPLSVGGATAESSGGAQRGQRVRADDIANLFPDLTLCVLQATPTETEMRTDTDREQAAYLRIFAADLFVLGFPVVLTIPPLPASVASAVMARIARAISDLDRQGSAGLLEAVAAARVDIMKLSPVHPEAKLEAALDICLFAADADPRPARRVGPIGLLRPTGV